MPATPGELFACFIIPTWSTIALAVLALDSSYCPRTRLTASQIQETRATTIQVRVAERPGTKRMWLSSCRYSSSPLQSSLATSTHMKTYAHRFISIHTYTRMDIRVHKKYAQIQTRIPKPLRVLHTCVIKDSEVPVRKCPTTDRLNHILWN